MSKHRSPWIHQLNRTRPIATMHGDEECDVAIVGGGIAGISTAFFILKNTNKKVVLLEANKVAHGATGHNAGHVVSYFERHFHEIALEFGLPMAAEGQRDIELSWELIDEMYTEAGLDIYFSRFIGYDGYSTFDRVITHLRESSLRKAVGLEPNLLYVSDTRGVVENIPEEYEDFYAVVTKREIQRKLETERVNFIAVAEQRKGVINSALFTEGVAAYLLEKYKDRFSLFEDSRVQKLVLKQDYAILDVGKHCVEAGRVVLCTNGFENFEIFNTKGLDIDTSFHHEINGVVARMHGYLENINKPPMAIGYWTADTDESTGWDDYYYLTRRLYEYNDNKHNLICLGGPQSNVPDRAEYQFEYEFEDEVEKKADAFLRTLYDIDPNEKIEYIFSWHGLMGYTPNGVRRIGAEPLNPVLLYNLGCNGVGILPSIYGGKRISRIISGERLSLSIFDPHDSSK